MKPLFPVKPVDSRFYDERLRDFLPAKIIDMHTHVWRQADRPRRRGRKAPKPPWPSLVARENPIEDLLETYRLLLPGKQVTPVIFSSAGRDDDLDRLNGYIRACARTHRLPALLYATPAWSGPELERRMRIGKFVGVKVYLSLAPAHIPASEVRIFDFLPHHQLEALNKHGWIAMLHIPRTLRLRDPVNLAQMLEIEKRYPRVKLIVAHVGRAYCESDVGRAFDVLADTERMLFDFSANTNAAVFEQLIRAVGPGRILFGSDLPILRMRMRRICERGVYVNLVPKGLYGDLTGVAHMREVSGKAADRLSFFLYEELDAFRRAARKTQLTDSQVEDVFHNNAARLLAAAGPKEPQLRMVWRPRGRATPLLPPVPRGYALRTFRPGDARGYVSAVQSAGLGKDWTTKTVPARLARAVPGGLFLVVHRKTRQIVAACAAEHSPRDGHPDAGELGWVAVHPAHRGKGLGLLVCAAALRRLLDIGYGDVHLLTDDFRLPAIKTYLKLGFVPCLYAAGMTKRWKEVCTRLNLVFAGSGAVKA
ncbi:MAG: GNAT family N-acetyltransferase [Kiritimatiellae bacterium]|nr:GNAT family N-acetyltransferase [Kiritimatiellia bacterium]